MPRSNERPTPRPRSRAGCLVCRSRRVKCDEEQPACGRCRKFNAECRYPDKKQFSDAKIAASLASRHEYRLKLKREAGTISEEADDVPEPKPTRAAAPPPLTVHHRSTSESSRSPVTPVSRYSGDHGQRPDCPCCPSPVSRERDWFKFEAPAALFRQTRMGKFYNGPTDPPSVFTQWFPSVVERRCFHHCLMYTLSIMVTSEKNNPWVEHVARLCFLPQETPSTKALKSALLSFGATHLYSIQLKSPEQVDDADYHGIAHRHRALSACGLREVIKGGGPEVESDTFLAAALTLLMCDVFAASTHWREIWRYVVMSVRRRGGPKEMLFGSGIAPNPLRRLLIGHVAFWDFVVSLNTMTPPALLTGDVAWWGQLRAIGPISSSSDLDWHWLENFTAMNPALLAISTNVVRCAAERAELERVCGPVQLNERQIPIVPAGTGPREIELSQSAANVKDELERWRYENPTELSSLRVQIGSLALWHASRIILLTQVYSYNKMNPDVQASARAVIEMCFEAGDKPEFMQIPLMVACSVLEDPEQRDSARAIFKNMEYVAVFEVQSLQFVSEECWKRMADGVDDEGCRWPNVMTEAGRATLIC
ncbi:hypothetical protein Q8F55_001601 [Vanrija albida]|uniref:Zn(2)-C6 fungal-type domain-containing protein n=1 Tax=Vanrija albida TaxID=181172 RepID=A0ABR3QGM1_9TREE